LVGGTSASTVCGCVIQLDAVTFLLVVYATVLSSFVDERLVRAFDTVFRSMADNLRSEDVQRDSSGVR